MTALTVEQRLQMLIGAYTFQITAAQVENEQLKARVAELEAQVPKKETDPAGSNDLSAKKKPSRK